MNNNDAIIINALCRKIEDQERYIKQLEDAIVFRITEGEKKNAGQTATSLR